MNFYLRSKDYLLPNGHLYSDELCEIVLIYQFNMSTQEEIQNPDNAPDAQPVEKQEPIDLQKDQINQDGAQVDTLVDGVQQQVANQSVAEQPVVEGAGEQVKEQVKEPVEQTTENKAQTAAEQVAPKEEEGKVNQQDVQQIKEQEGNKQSEPEIQEVFKTGVEQQQEEKQPAGELLTGIDDVVKMQEEFDTVLGQINTQVDGEGAEAQLPGGEGAPAEPSSRAQNLLVEENQRTAVFPQESVAPLTQSSASHPTKSVHLAPSLEIATAAEQRRAYNSSLTTPQNQIVPIINKDRSEVVVGKSQGENMQSGTPRGLEQGITEVLSHLERTMQSYEQKLGESPTANNVGTGRRGQTPPSDLVSHQRPGSRTSTSTNYDPEKQKKLQAIMKRIKQDIGQMKEALDEEKTSQLPAADSQASPSQGSRPIDLRSRQESRGRRQHSSSQISQLNNLMRVGQNAVPSGSHFVPEADGALTTKRMKTLKSIFDFYSRQHLNIGRSATFEKIERSMQRLSLGEYMKFIADFKILQEYDMQAQEIKSTCTSAFKAVAENKRDIDFYMFKASLYIVFRIEDQDPAPRGEDEPQQERAAQPNKKLTFGQQPLMITDGRSQGSAARNKDLEEAYSKQGFENPPLFDLQDKELIEERIAAALFLDKPSQVNLIQQGFMVPFHMRDAKRHSPEKQIQPKINVKTVELTEIEKEAIRLRIKAMKIERELNRPQVNMDKTEQAYRPIRDTFQKLKLPDEKKLKKALAKALRELEQFEERHPVEVRALEEKMANKQKMYEKVEGQTARSRRLENIQEEFSTTGGDEKSRGDFLAIKDHQEDGHDIVQHGELSTVPEVDSARFQQPPRSQSRSPGLKKSIQEDGNEATLQEPLQNREEEMDANVQALEQEEEKIEEEEPLPEDITSYYTLEALTQVKDYQQLNKIIGIVREQNQEQKWSPGERLPANPYESPHHGNGSLKLAADPSQNPSHSIISLDLDHGPALQEQEVPRHSDLLQGQEPERNLEEEERTQNVPEVTEAGLRASLEGQEVSNYVSRTEQIDQNQSIFRPSLIGLDDNNQLTEMKPSELLRQNSKPEVVYNNQLAVQSQEQQPFERMRASRMNLLNASMRDQNQNQQMDTVMNQHQRNQPLRNTGQIRLNLYNQDDFLNADLQLNPDQQEYRENNATFNALPTGQEGGEYFVNLQQNQPSTQRALLDQENEAMLRNAPQYRDMRSRKVANQPILKGSPRNMRGSSRQSKLTASHGTTEMATEPQRDARPEYSNIAQRQDALQGHRGLQPSASANLMNSDETSNEKIAREFLESHRRMQQEQRRLDHQYNRIKVELDHDTQQYNKFNMQPVHEVQGPQYRNGNEIVYKAGGGHTNDRQAQQAQSKSKQEMPSTKNISSSQKKANHKAQAHPPNRRLEKRIYQVNDLKQMGILKNSQNNQSDSNLRLPAIETATLPAPDFADDSRAYPHSSLPIINQSINTSSSAYNVLGPGGHSQAAIGPRQKYHHAYEPLPSNRNAGSSEGPARTLDASAAPIFHPRKSTKPSRSQMSSLKQPAQRRQKGERGPPQSQARPLDKLTPDRVRVNKSQRRVEDRRGYISIQQQVHQEKSGRTDRRESKDASSVATRDSVDLERDRQTRQQAATAMQEVYHAGIERNRLNLGPLLRNDQHRRLPSKEQAEVRTSQMGTSKDYEYDLPKKQKPIFGVNNQTLGNPRAQLRGGPQKNESLHQNFQRPNNGNEYIYEDLGEQRDAQHNYTVNQSTTSLSQHQRQQRASRYSQSKQGPGGHGKPPRQGPPSSLGHASGTRQAQSYAQLARNAKQRKTTINHDDYAQMGHASRLSSTSLSKKAGPLNEDLGSEYDRTMPLNQSYQPSPHYTRHAPDSRSEIPSNQAMLYHPPQSQSYGKIPAVALRRQNEPLRAGYPRLPAATHHPQQQSHLQHKQRLKNMRVLANSVESRTQRQRPHPSEMVGSNYSAMGNGTGKYYGAVGNEYNS